MPVCEPVPVFDGVPDTVLEGVCIGVCVTVPDVEGVAPCDKDAVGVDGAEPDAVMDAV